MAPKVSIVTCSYNRPDLLRAAINSLRQQTDQDWEHLIYDDASTDPEVFDVLAWANYDPRVRIWRGAVNRDQPSALWNFMLDRAHGKYFTVLDDDNEKLPTFVEKMSKELDNDPNIDVVTCGWRVDRTDGGPGGDYFLNLSTSTERLSNLSTCDGGAMLYRRTIFERVGYFPEDQRTNEDWDWLRRAAHAGKVKNLHEVHATYRSHNGSRMNRAHALGNDSDVIKVKARPVASTIGLRAVYPPEGRLTQSQRDVCSGIARAVPHIPWVVAGNDICLVVSPFQKSNEEITQDAAGCARIVSLHMEDPYALSANLDRVQHMAGLCETWVCTNDAATVPYYRKLVGDRVIVYPSLSADATIPALDCRRDIDVLLCGYAYPSRKAFITKLLPLLQGLHVVLVGDGWEGCGRSGVKVMSTQSLVETYQIHRRAKAVVCLHRVHGDCSDGAVEPHTVNRGYLEGYSGARVFIDSTRPYHGLDDNDVIWYQGPGDLAGALTTYLAAPQQNNAFVEKCRTLYTYRTRIVRILNCVRAPRYLAEIP